jgi:hypothetical protein
MLSCIALVIKNKIKIIYHTNYRMIKLIIYPTVQIVYSQSDNNFNNYDELQTISAGYVGRIIFTNCTNNVQFSN